MAAYLSRYNTVNNQGSELIPHLYLIGFLLMELAVKYVLLLNL